MVDTQSVFKGRVSHGLLGPALRKIMRIDDVVMLYVISM